MESIHTNRHITCLMAVFTFANAAITLPAVSAGPIQMVTALVLSFPVILALNLLSLRFLGKAGFLAAKGFHKFLLAAGISLAAIAALFFAFCAVRDFAQLTKDEILPQTSDIIIVTLFALVVLALSVLGVQAVLKFSLIVFPAIIILAAALFLMALPQMNAKQLLPAGAQYLPPVQGTIKGYLSAFAPSLILIPLIGANKPGGGRKGLLPGTLLGGGVLLLLLAHTLMIFGGDYAAQLKYPYLYAVSTVSAGELFFRMDGFTYAIYFFACLTKVAACICVARMAAARMFKSQEKFVPPVCCAGIVMIYIFLR